MPQLLKEKDFEKTVLEQSHHKPIILDFFGQRCMPCQELMQVFSEIKPLYQGISIYKVDFQEANKLSEKFKVGQVPDVRVFKNGEIIASFVGAKNKTEVQEFIDAAIA